MKKSWFAAWAICKMWKLSTKLHRFATNYFPVQTRIPTCLLSWSALRNIYGAWAKWLWANFTPRLLQTHEDSFNFSWSDFTPWLLQQTHEDSFSFSWSDLISWLLQTHKDSFRFSWFDCTPWLSQTQDTCESFSWEKRLIGEEW